MLLRFSNSPASPAAREAIQAHLHEAISRPEVSTVAEGVRVALREMRTEALALGWTDEDLDPVFGAYGEATGDLFLTALRAGLLSR